MGKVQPSGTSMVRQLDQHTRVGPKGLFVLDGSITLEWVESIHYFLIVLMFNCLGGFLLM